MVTILELIKTADVGEMKSQLTAMQAELAATIKERECDINLMRLLIEAAGVAQSKGRDDSVPMGRVPEIVTGPVTEVAVGPAISGFQWGTIAATECPNEIGVVIEGVADAVSTTASDSDGLFRGWSEPLVATEPGTITPLPAWDSYVESSVTPADPVPIQPPVEAIKPTREIVAVPVIQHAKPKAKPKAETATSLTVADRAMIYLQAAGAPCTAMGIAGGLDLPVPSTLVKVLESDERFEKNSKGFWTLKG